MVGITASASDADATTNAVTYSLFDDAGGRFTINSTTGVVTVNGALDYETSTSHSVTVRATSADGSFGTQSFTIDVTDVNDPPVADAGATQLVTSSEVLFDGTGSTDADGTVVAWDWNFGDGSTGSRARRLQRLPEFPAMTRSRKISSRGGWKEPRRLRRPILSP